MAVTDKMRLEVLLATIDKATAPLKAITAGSNNTAKALKAARDNLRSLNQQQGQVDAFRKLSADAAITANQLKATQTRIAELTREIKATDTPTKAMVKELASLKREGAQLKDRHTELIQKQQQLRVSMNENGISTSKLNAFQKTLKTDMAAATVEVKKQTAALEQHNKRQQAISAAKAQYHKGIELRNQLAGAGVATGAAGVAIGAPVMQAVKNYREFETAMLGVARQVQGARDDTGQLTPLYYEMGEAVKALSERLPLTAIEFAQIVEGAARMGIQGKDNLLSFAEAAAIMADAFELPVDQLSEDMGQIANLYKIPIKDIRELGDTVNWLDDNALSKGGDIIDVMKRIAGQADMVGMSYKDAAALGSTFLSLGAGSEVAATASNAMMARLANAPILSTAKRYREGLAMLNLEAGKLQKNMASNATGTILEVLDKIRALPKEKQLEAATRLFGVEYGDDASKLAANLDEYRRQLKLVNDEQARGSMQRESDARNASQAAQESMALEAIKNNMIEIGKILRPVYIEILQGIKSVAQATREWMQEHPILTSYIVKGAAALAIMLVGIGGLMTAIAAIMGPMLLFRMGLQIASANGLGMASSVLKMNSAFGVLGGGVMKLLGPLAKIWAAWEIGYAIGTKLNNLLDDFFTKINGGKAYSLGSWVYDVTHNEGTRTSDRTGGHAGRFKKSTPIMAGAGAGSSSQTIHAPITVNAAPGMDEQALAKAVSKEVEATHRRGLARGRSRLSDRD